MSDSFHFITEYHPSGNKHESLKAKDNSSNVFLTTLPIIHPGEARKQPGYYDKQLPVSTKSLTTDLVFSRVNFVSEILYSSGEFAAVCVV